MKHLFRICTIFWPLPLLAQPGDFIPASEPTALEPQYQKDPADRQKFAYSTYAHSSFAQMSKMSTKGTGVLRIFSAKRRVVLTLPAFPSAGLTDDENSALQAYGKLNPTIKPLVPVFGHKLSLEVAGTRFLLLFQSQVVPYISKESKVGENIVLYVLHATYNDFSGVHLLLVTDFYVPK